VVKAGRPVQRLLLRAEMMNSPKPTLTRSGSAGIARSRTCSRNPRGGKMAPTVEREDPPAARPDEFGTGRLPSRRGGETMKKADRYVKRRRRSLPALKRTGKSHPEKLRR
jgi:hypothetical protein